MPPLILLGMAAPWEETSAKVPYGFNLLGVFPLFAGG